MKITDDALLEVFRHRACERCGAAPPSEPHHVLCLGFGGGGRMDVCLNLLAVCRMCHGAVQEDPEWCLTRVAEREGLESGVVVQEALWRLRQRRKP